MAEKEGHVADNGFTQKDDVNSLPVGPEDNLSDQHHQLERGLKSRHIQFLALGKFAFLNPTRASQSLVHGGLSATPAYMRVVI
jgi:hypothetical protein